MPEETIKKFGRDLAQGLYYLHANNIIYADLKPSNVLMNEYNTLKLCDFGLSKKLNDLVKPEEVDAITIENPVVNSRGYNISIIHKYILPASAFSGF